MKKTLCLPGFLCLLLSAWLCPAGYGQAAGTVTASDLAKATDFHIPSSPAFALLGVSPAQVQAPGFINDFRLDWVVKENQLVSDIAFDMQPLWLLGFRNVSASEYRNMSAGLRAVSTLSTSIGTARRTADQRSLALATKLTVYRQVDPLADASYTRRLSDALAFSFDEARLGLQMNDVIDTVEDADQEAALVAIVDSVLARQAFDLDNIPAFQALSLEQRKAISLHVDALDSLFTDLAVLSEATRQRLQRIKLDYETRNWNKARLDVGGGWLFNYDTPALDSLQFQSAGYGAWLNGATGFNTSQWLVSALGRLTRVDDETEFFLGSNLRYGGKRINFFVEYGYAVREEENGHEISYGGTLTLSEQLTVQFGIRTSYDEDFKPIALVPQVQVNGASLGRLARFLPSSL